VISVKVLIADDESISRMILEKLLKKEGYEVTSCSGGKDALSKYEEGQFRLVITDWLMPDLDGLEICRSIRSSKNKSYTYVILVTARTGKENILVGYDAGADDYLTKPVDIDELAARLRVANRILSLQNDLDTLHQIIPICAWCKKIRDDAELWQSAEAYLSSHLSADLSHSICPSCAQKQKF
jgi:sigma-B regulation protein RsbU (phosphoserine phosphatase)